MSDAQPYQLLVRLIKIMLILAAFSVSVRDTDRLQNMVEEFLGDLLHSLPGFSLTPKFHYMLSCIMRIKFDDMDP